MPHHLLSVSLVVILTLTACSGDDNPGAADAGTPPSLDAGTEPVYYGQVQRILDDHCVACHGASEDRLAPFSLASYEDAVDAAGSWPLAYVIMNRIMPPYYADNSGSCQSFRDTHWLSDEDIATLTAWSNGKRLAGDPADATPPPAPPPTLDEVSATIDPGASFRPSGELRDEYRCFVVDPGLVVDGFLSGFHVRPGNDSIVHHVILYDLPDAAAEADAESRDAAEPGLGYRCFGGPGPAGASFVIGWAPGNEAVFFPPDTGVRIAAGRKMVMQVHYNLDNGTGDDRTRIEMQLEDQVAHEAQIVSVANPGLSLPPGMPSVASSASVTLPAGTPDRRVWGVALHMHERGIDARVTRTRGSEEECAIDLTQWNFHWQHFYWYTQPTTVTGGDRIELTCTYDTSDDVSTVTWGEGTDDEMCIAYFYVTG